tara:strand:+ start:383 stop:1480 length:1098 start_codon:yes stop_codon:yes gene_type:complete
MDKKITFLTEKQIDKEKLLQILRKDFKKIPGSNDKDILNKVISLIETKNLLISPQETHFLNSNPDSIWAEYLIFRHKFENFPKEKTVVDFPFYVLIEPVSACNLRCIMCFQIDKTFSNDRNFMGSMDISLFKKIIDECKSGGTKAITLASRGEPTLHPNLGEMLEYCKDKFLELKLNTNATKLTEKLCHQILKSGVTDLVFSVDSYAKEEYESIRIKGVFEEVLNNIKRFQKIREEYPNSKIATRVSGVKVESRQDPKKFKEFWENYVDHVVMVEMENRWDTYHNPKEIMGAGPCNYLWERMYVWYDGICNPCDADYKSELSVGSVKNSTIKEIWNSKKYQKLRELHTSNKRDNCFPCDRCPIGN